MDAHEIKIAKELYESGLSLAEIGRRLNHDSTTIKRNLQKNNVKLRTRAEQNVLTNMARANAVNKNYFSNIGVNQAWLMGFIAADGSIAADRNAIKINLSTKDKEILEKIRNEVKITSTVKDYLTNNGFEISSLVWSCKEHKDFLASYGIVDNKTYKPMTVPNLSRENKLAFVLGYFDGDGSISINGNYLRLRIVAHRREILESIANFLKEEYEITYSLSQDNRSLYELSISTSYCVKIFEDMYNLNSLRLKRKYDKFLEYKNQETTTSLIKG